MIINFIVVNVNQACKTFLLFLNWISNKHFLIKFNAKWSKDTEQNVHIQCTIQPPPKHTQTNTFE